MPHTFNVSFTITDEEISDILTTAIEGGIGYWACLLNDDPDWIAAREIVKNRLQDTPCYCDVGLELLKTGKAIKFEDEEDGTIHELTMEKLLQGCAVFAKEEGKSPSKMLADGDFDANDADMLIQYALFGEVIYG